MAYPALSAVLLNDAEHAVFAAQRQTDGVFAVLDMVADLPGRKILMPATTTQETADWRRGQIDFRKQVVYATNPHRVNGISGNRDTA